MIDADVARIPLQVSRGCVVASIQIDLSESTLNQLRADLLSLLHTSGAHGVILEVSGVTVMDRQDFDVLRRTIAMAEVMGATSILAGLRPGVVASLIDLDIPVDSIHAARDLDHAFLLMDTLRFEGDASEIDEQES